MNLPIRKLATSSGTMWIAALLSFPIPTTASAEELLGSLSFQDDVFFGHDGGGYSSGVFLSRVRVASAGEAEIAVPALFEPWAAWLGMGGTTLAAWSIGQIMFTPRDLSLPVPDPDDVPYVGALVVRSTDVWVQGDVLDMLAVDLGVVGPASGAARTQAVVHRLIGSTRPEGWGTQGSNQWFAGVERYRGWRMSPASLGSTRAQADLVTLAGVSLGNLQSSIAGSAIFRYGTGLERSFPTLARVASNTGDPMVLGRGWFGYAGVSVQRFNGDVELGARASDGNVAHLRRLQDVRVAGIAYGWDDLSLTFSVQNASSLVQSRGSRQTYGSLTFTWRLF